MTEPLLELQQVHQRYRQRRSRYDRGRAGTVHAVNGVTLSVAPGETIGVVGESGCGKSTLARLMVGLESPTEGQVLFGGRPLTELDRRDRKTFHRRVQMIFQDPQASLNPRRTVGDSIAEGIITHRLLPRHQLVDRVGQLLEQVGMDPGYAERYPHEFSGGQLQRIGIARALALEPQVLVCDEPVSALDISVRAQVLNLLNRLKASTGVSLVFIAHDLDVVQHMSDRIVTMYLGKIVEIGAGAQVADQAAHPYTRALLSAVPRRAEPGISLERVVLQGDPPSPVELPSGCAFHTRCYAAIPDCADKVPPLQPVLERPHHRSACLLADQITTSTVGIPHPTTSST